MLNEERKLRDYCSKNKLHLSKNTFKKNDDNSYIIMATIRDYNCTQEQFKDNVFSEKDKIIGLGLEIDKVIIEFAIYDTNVSHDSEWLLNS